MEYLSLGSVPGDEKCAQIGDPDYYEKCRQESNRYIAQLKRMFPEWENKGCFFKKKGFNHDFGVYHEVVIFFDEKDEASCEYAHMVENNLPANWDNEENKE